MNIPDSFYFFLLCLFSNNVLSSFFWLNAAKKDATKGMGSGWERFEFDKDAPLDEDDGIEGFTSLTILPFRYILE